MATGVEDVYLEVCKFVSDGPALVASVEGGDAEVPGSAFWSERRGLDREILSPLGCICIPTKRELLIRELRFPHWSKLSFRTGGLVAPCARDPTSPA